MDGRYNVSSLYLTGIHAMLQQAVQTVQMCGHTDVDLNPKDTLHLSRKPGHCLVGRAL